MVQLIVGKKGKGKTKHLLDKVNSEVQKVSGNIVYLDKSTKHMYELNNKIRLIDVSSKIACMEEGTEIEAVIQKLEKISEAFGVDFVLSVSKDEEELPASVKDKIIVSL